MPKPWSEHDYLSAISEAGNKANPPEVQEALQQRIRQYERAQGPGHLGRATGIEAFEERTGMSLPADRKTRDAQHEESQNPKLPDIIGRGEKYERAKEIRGEKYDPNPYWYEPSLDEFQAEMGRVLGPDEAAAVTEDDPLFQRYADAKWAQAYDKALNTGGSLIRARDIEGTVDKVASEVTRYGRSGVLAVEEGLTGGLLSSGAAKLQEVLGTDPDASDELERERAMGGRGVRTVGNIAGIVSPASIFSKAAGAASKLAAPVAGAAVIKGGGGLGSRMLGRGAVAATGGAAGMAAHGGAADIAQGTNPFSLDFLGRRGTDAAIGAAAGVGGELLGAGAARLGRRGEISRARDIRAEGALSKPNGINPVLEAMGATPATLAELQQAPIGSLIAAALAGNGLGRYALIARLGNKAVQSGEGAFKGMAERLSTAPLPPDVVGAIRERMITKGGEVFSKTGSGGGGLGLPFTSGASPASPTTLSREEAEAFINDLIEEDRIEQEKIEAVGEDDVETDPIEPEDGASSDSVQPIGFGSVPGATVSPDRVLDLFDDEAPPRDYKQDPEFMAALSKLGPWLKSEGRAAEIPDYEDAYIRNYPAWRASQDEGKKEGGDFDPSTHIDPAPRRKALGISGYADAEPRGTELEDTSREERAVPLTAELRPELEKRLKKKYPEGYTIDQVVKVVTHWLQQGDQPPHPDLVEQSMKNLEYPMPRKWVQQRVRRAARNEKSL